MLRFALVFFYMANIVYYELLKGSIYLIFLSPTLLIVVSIYSIWNIHNVSWGSRPGKNHENNKKKSEVSRKIELEYKNYRSNFLVRWAIWNIVIAKAIQISYFEQYQWAIWGFLIFMISLFVMQLFLSIISMFRDCYRNTLIRSHKSDYFERVSLLIVTCCQVIHLFLLNQKLNS